MYTAQDKLEQAQKLKERRQQALSTRVKAEVADMSSEEEDQQESKEPEPSKPASAQPAPTAPVASTSAVTLGSGLKRSADGQLAMPTVTKRKRIKTAWGRLPIGVSIHSFVIGIYDSLACLGCRI